MALFIEQIHNVFADLAGKNIATKHPPERVDRVLYLIIVDLFNKYLDHYVKTKKISDYLLSFKRVKTLALVNGSITLPEDFAHHRALRTSAGIRIDLVEDLFWNNRLNRKLGPPSATRPIARIENNDVAEPVKKLEVLPVTITDVVLQYFKYPTAPEFAYDVVGSRYVYDEASSTDVEFPIGLYPDIINRLMSHFGIVLREGQVLQIAEQLKTQEQAK